VAKFTLSDAARADLLEIAKYSEREWGRAQARSYTEELRACCARIASSPLTGRAADNLRHGLRRREQGSHVVFYSIEQTGVVIRRILHKGMAAEQHSY
jgi:toxin ParE1/3/4